MSSTEACLRHRRLIVLVLLVVAAACSEAAETGAVDGGQRGSASGSLPAAAPDDTRPDTETAAPAQDSPAPPPCRVDRLPDEPVLRLASSDAAQLSLEIAGRTHRCAPTVVVAPADDPWASAIAAPAALALDAPLLLLDDAVRSAVAARLGALGTREVLAIGVDATGLPGRITRFGRPLTDARADDTGSLDHLELAIEVAGHLGVTRLLAVPQADASARTAALVRADGNAAILPVPDDPTVVASLAASLLPTARIHVLASSARVGAQTADALLAVGLDAVQPGPLAPRPGDTSWLVDHRRASAMAVTAVAAAAREDSLLPIDAGDLRRDRVATDRLRTAAPERVILVGTVTPDASWQLPLILAGSELPGGGFTLFDDERMVALSGAPDTDVPGALDEQLLADTLARLRELAAPYAADGVRVLPTLEIVTTAGAASPPEHGDVDRRTPVEELRWWVELAAVEDVYVVLDLQPGQPGSSDLLTQARDYEVLLREPHVGLGLTPTWRPGSEARKAEDTGSTDVREIEDLATWLAELTRRNNLPQKLLLVDQSHPSMLPDGDTIEVPPELAMVIRMDAPGSLAEKQQRYAAITDAAENRWSWGWSNVHEQDDPVATPQQVLGLEPPPAFVSSE